MFAPASLLTSPFSIFFYQNINLSIFKWAAFYTFIFSLFFGSLLTAYYELTFIVCIHMPIIEFKEFSRIESISSFFFNSSGCFTIFDFPDIVINCSSVPFGANICWVVWVSKWKLLLMRTIYSFFYFDLRTPRRKQKKKR